MRLERPCQCGKCSLCKRIDRDPKLSALYGPANGSTEPPAPPDPACIHLGDEYTVQEKRTRGLDLSKTWAPCERPGFERYGLPVCSCQGCGPRCPGYEAVTS